MTPSDAQPHADEVGCPDDGHGQAPPVIFTEPNTVAITREPCYMQHYRKTTPLIDFMPEQP